MRRQISALAVVLGFLLIASFATAAPTFVYVNNNVSPNNTVSLYSVDSSGQFAAVGSPVSTGGNGSSADSFFSSTRIVVSPKGYLYAANDGSNTISAFSINTTTGALTAVGSPAATDGTAGNGISLALTGDGKYLIAAHANGSGTNVVRVFTVGQNGGLAAAYTGSIPGPAGSAAASSNGKFVAITLPNSKQVAIFAVAFDGTLTAVTGSPFYYNSHGNPRAVSYNCAVDRLYVNYGETGQAYAAAFSVAANGAIAILGGDLNGGGSRNTHIGFLSPKGTQLWSLSTDVGKIVGFNVAGDGTITALTGSPFTPSGGQLNGFHAAAPDSTGNFILAVTGDSPAQLTAIDTTTLPSALTRRGSINTTGVNQGVASYPPPSCVPPDTTAPVSTATVSPQPNTNTWNNADVTVTLSSTATDVKQITYSATGANPIGSSVISGSSGAFNIAAEGITTISYFAEDTSGNKESPNTLVVKLDKTAPTHTHTITPAAAASGWHLDPVTVAIDGQDGTGGSGVASIAYTATGANPATGSATGTHASVSITQDGETSLSCSPTDFAGNTQANAPNDPVTIKLDTQAPVSSYTIVPDVGATGWYTADVKLTINATDSGSGVKNVTYSSTGAQVIAQTTVTQFPAQVQITTEGTTDLSLFATDVAGKIESAKNLEFKLDKTKPIIACTAPANDPWYGTDVNIPCTASDAISHLASSPDGSFTLTATVAAGQETQNVSSDKRSVCDQAGNCIDAGPYTGYKIDRKAPQSQHAFDVAPNAAGWNKADVKLTLTAQDGGSGVKEIVYSATGATTVASTSVASGALLTITAEGTTTITYHAVDNVGNLEPDHTVVVKLDKTAPLANCESADTIWHNNNVNAACKPTDSVSGLASGTSDTITLSTNVPDLTETDAAQTNSEDVCDAAGNCTKAGPVGPFKIDRKPPTVTATPSASPNGAGWYKADVQITLTAEDHGSGVKEITYTLNGNTVTVGGASATVTISSEGMTTLSYSGTDMVGNIAATKQLDVKLDKTPPVANCGTPDSDWHNANTGVACTPTDAGGSGLLASVPTTFNLTTDVPADTETATAQTGTKQVCDNADNCITAGPISPFKIDRRPPTITATPSASPNAAGWYKADVNITLTAEDHGSGVKEITYSLDGVFHTASSSSANVTISADGTHTLTYSASDSVGNTASTSQLIIRLDKTQPIVSCGAADALWHDNNVTIACTANDATSGLANSALASFSLSTTVPDGTETNNASTNSQLVCDAADNCVTAGPITGNKIDKKAPVVTVNTPADGAVYTIGAAVAASYSCSDLSSCTSSGTVANGSNIATTVVGSYTFTVTATDAVGHQASVTVHYTVTYGVLALFDQTKSHKRGSTVPVKLQLVDANGQDVSNLSVVVQAVKLVKVDPSASPYMIDDSGNANPDSNFRFDPTLGPTGGYIFNLSTKPLDTGTFRLYFAPTGDPSSVHFVQFDVR